MSRRGTNPGRWVEVTQGGHKGKRGFAYHSDQLPEIRNAGKVCVIIDVEASQSALFPGMQGSEPKKVLFNPAFLKVIGFID